MAFNGEIGVGWIEELGEGMKSHPFGRPLLVDGRGRTIDELGLAKPRFFQPG